MKNTFRSLAYLSFSFFLLISCGNELIFEEKASIPDANWNKDNSLKFPVVISQHTSTCNLYFTIRNTELYPYRNLWLFVTLSQPNGNTLRDTFNCALADDKGKWFGDVSGDVIDHRLLYKKNYTFEQPGTYTFDVQQGMRSPDGFLPFITEVGLRIEKLADPQNKR